MPIPLVVYSSVYCSLDQSIGFDLIFKVSQNSYTLTVLNCPLEILGHGVLVELIEVCENSVAKLVFPLRHLSHHIGT